MSQLGDDDEEVSTSFLFFSFCHFLGRRRKENSKIQQGEKIVQIVKKTKTSGFFFCYGVEIVNDRFFGREIKDEGGGVAAFRDRRKFCRAFVLIIGEFSSKCFSCSTTTTLSNAFVESI